MQTYYKLKRHNSISNTLQQPTITSIIDVMKTTAWEESGFPSEFLGDDTVDVYLNDNARWSNVPTAVWNYKLGGYQVLKKWLSYRDGKVLGRNLTPEEVQHFTDTARRIAAIMGI